MTDTPDIEAEAQPFRLDDELRTELARKIVTHQMLVADLSRVEWQTSLALIIGGIPEESVKQVGLILVPMDKHMGGYWINGTAPGCTVAATLIHRDDVAGLDALVTKMDLALEATGLKAGEDHDV
jgi:hypothetical protein